MAFHQTRHRPRLETSWDQRLQQQQQHKTFPDEQDEAFEGLRVWGIGGTHVNGAAHERTPFQGLLHDLVELLGRLLHLVELSDAAGEVLHGLRGVAALQGLVGAVQPGGRRVEGVSHDRVHSRCVHRCQFTLFTLTVV